MELQAVGLLFGCPRNPNAGTLRKFYKFYSIGSDIEAKRSEIAKRNTSGRTIGGRSVWGNIIAPVLEKYHWTFDYVVWGISFTNLQMLLADSREYFPDYSGKSKDEEIVINADDPRNKKQMYELLGW